jgi:hypothetical protein
MNNVEIICPACGEESWLRREPVYDGLQRSGETLSCAACGHRFAAETDVPFKTRSEAPQVFDDADRPDTLRLFDENEARQLCRHCAHYTVNPFMQWCSEHKKEVEATDTCNRFTPAGTTPPAG